MNFDDLGSLDYGRSIGNVSALLLADAGYAPVNPPEWIAALRPQVVLLSVSAADKEGLPSPETLELLQGYTLLRTDRNGWIELSTDGESMWVEVERHQIKYRTFAPYVFLYLVCSINITYTASAVVLSSFLPFELLPTGAVRLDVHSVGLVGGVVADQVERAGISRQSNNSRTIRKYAPS
jgi:hypothetical protein